MPKFRCYMPKQAGDEQEVKKTKDGWDAFFVFDGPAAPKGMVCKELAEPKKPKPQAAAPVPALPATTAVPPPKAVTAVVAGPAGDNTPTALAVVGTPTEQDNPADTEAKADSSAETVGTVGLADSQPQIDQSNPSAFLSEAALAVVAAAATLALSGMFSSTGSSSSSKGKSSKGKGKSSPKQDAQSRAEQQRKKDEEKKREECGAKTETAKQDADRGGQHFERVSGVLSELSRHLTVFEEQQEALLDLADEMAALTQRIAVLELKQKGSSKHDSEPRTARRRQQKPATQQQPAAAKAPRPRRT